MKTLISPRVLALAAIACGALAAAPAVFAQGTFTPGTGSSANCNPANPPYTFDSVSCSVDTDPGPLSNTVSVSMTAWGYTSPLSTTAATGWVQGRVGDFNSNGFGAYTGTKESTTDSQHAFDNVTTGCGSGSGADSGSIPLSTANSGCGGAVEAALLSFSAAVSMSKVGVGYVSGDGDMSVYAWTGGGSGPNMSTQKLSTTGAGTLEGWTLVGSNDFNGAGTWTFASSSPYSSYFLITTYFGAASNSNLGADSGLTSNDRFKINSFTVACDGSCSPSQTSVPEPASLALASLGLVAALGVRRRGNRKPH